jgi:hypothetical protein
MSDLGEIKVEHRHGVQGHVVFFPESSHSVRITSTQNEDVRTLIVCETLDVL